MTRRVLVILNAYVDPASRYCAEWSNPLCARKSSYGVVHRWDGEPYKSYPPGAPELSILKITLPPHSKLEWHSHPIPSAAYIVAGELTLERKTDGKKQLFTAGQAVSETVDTLHRGVVGNQPVVLIVFYAGGLGVPLTEAPRP